MRSASWLKSFFKYCLNLDSTLEITVVYLFLYFKNHNYTVLPLHPSWVLALPGSLSANQEPCSSSGIQSASTEHYLKGVRVYLLETVFTEYKSKPRGR